MARGQQDQAAATLLREHQCSSHWERKPVCLKLPFRGLFPSSSGMKSLATLDVLHACLCSDESHFSNPLHSSCTRARISGNVLGFKEA